MSDDRKLAGLAPKSLSIWERKQISSVTDTNMRKVDGSDMECNEQTGSAGKEWWTLKGYSDGTMLSSTTTPS